MEGIILEGLADCHLSKIRKNIHTQANYRENNKNTVVNIHKKKHIFCQERRIRLTLNFAVATLLRRHSNTLTVTRLFYLEL